MGRVAGRASIMGRVAIAALSGSLLAWPALGKEASVPVPSGQDVQWVETLHDTQGPEGLTYRFRFVAPGIGGAHPVSAEVAQKDMEALCNGFALPRISGPGPKPMQIVISLSDRPTRFGAADEGVVQYFEAYSIADGACVWDLF